MPDVNILRPEFSQEDAEQIAQKHYSLTASAAELPSERDQNFLLSTADGRHYILKIAGRTESVETLQLENALMAQLQQSAVAHLVPQLASNGVSQQEIYSPQSQSK